MTDKERATKRRGAVIAAVGAAPELGCACVWFTITAVNNTSLTVLDNDGRSGKTVEREIPYRRISKLMSAGKLESLIRAGRAVVSSQDAAILIRKKRRRRAVR